LLDFLNELLYEEQGRIVSISYLKLERLGISSNSRRAIFDLYCENEKGEKFIVELQKEEQQFFKDRTVFYSTFPIIEQAPKKGNWHFELKAVYVIAILDFVFEEDENDLQKYRYDIKLTDIQTKKVFYDKLTFIYLEMPKFTKELNELETRFEKWMYVLRNITLLDNLPDNFRESIFEKIFEAAEIAQLTQAEYISYMDDIKVYWDLSSCIYTANAKGLAEGLEKGLEKGLKKGLKKGRAEGRAEGKAEAKSEILKLQQEIKTLKQQLKKIATTLPS
jgi:predicted transposase/invertase (TIGR01784 family)